MQDLWLNLNIAQGVSWNKRFREIRKGKSIIKEKKKESMGILKHKARWKGNKLKEHAMNKWVIQKCLFLSSIKSKQKILHQK